MTDIQILYTGPVVKRSEARELRLTKYFTGNPCKNGHIDERWTCSARCLKCQSISSRRHFKENEEKYKKASSMRSKENWANNKEELSAKHKQWRINNLDKRAQYLRNWWYGREDERNAARREWAANNPERAAYHNKKNREENRETHRSLAREYRARKYKSEGKHTKEDVERIILSQENRCAEPTCRADFSDTGYHVDHIMPLILGGSNWAYNLQCLCPKCNSRKGGKHPDEWDRLMGRKA